MMTRCIHVERRAGHGLRSTTARPPISNATAANRRSRYVSGPAYGNPNFAEMKPVLQSTTNSAGANATDQIANRERNASGREVDDNAGGMVSLSRRKRTGS